MERDVEKAKNKTPEKESDSSPDDGQGNSQLVVKSYVDAIMDRTKLLLYVTMAADDPTTPLTSDYKGDKITFFIMLLMVITEPVVLSPTTGPSLLRSFSAPPSSLTKYSS